MTMKVKAVEKKLKFTKEASVMTTLMRVTKKY